MNNDLMFSSKQTVYETPQGFFDEINAEFKFTLDAAASPENAKCGRYFTENENGLAQDWKGETVWVNPPYARGITGLWVEKAFQESKHATVVLLLPARTDTAYFHDYCLKGEVRFVRGRLKFGGCKDAAPFPSALVIFRRKSFQ